MVREGHYLRTKWHLSEHCGLYHSLDMLHGASARCTHRKRAVLDRAGLRINAIIIDLSRP
jgi:hypothetical protein